MKPQPLIVTKLVIISPAEPGPNGPDRVQVGPNCTIDANGTTTSYPHFPGIKLLEICARIDGTTAWTPGVVQANELDWSVTEIPGALSNDTAQTLWVQATYNLAYGTEMQPRDFIGENGPPQCNYQFSSYEQMRPFATEIAAPLVGAAGSVEYPPEELPRYYQLRLDGISGSLDAALAGGLLGRASLFLEWDEVSSTLANPVYRSLPGPGVEGVWRLSTQQGVGGYSAELCFQRRTERTIQTPIVVHTANWNWTGPNAMHGQMLGDEFPVPVTLQVEPQ